MMDINFSPILTTRNYGVNSVKVDDSVFCTKILDFNGTKIENDVDFLAKNMKKTAFSNKIGEKFDNQLANDANVKLSFNIDKNTDKPLLVQFDFSKDECTLVEDVSICVRKNIEAKIILKFFGCERSYHNGIVRLTLEEGAKVDVALVEDFAENSVSVLRVDACLEKKSTLNFTEICFGGKVSIQNYYAKLCEENAVSNLNSIYVAGGEEFVDLNYVQDVFGKKCEANIQTVGALFGKAKKHFKGTINFEKGCKKSKGVEDELCLLLSKTAKSKALPMLLCTEEEVDGQHSSSVGQMDAQTLFYLMSRGLSKKDALKLFVKAKFAVVLEKVFDGELKKNLLEMIEGKLSYEED